MRAFAWSAVNVWVAVRSVLRVVARRVFVVVAGPGNFGCLPCPVPGNGGAVDGLARRCLTPARRGAFAVGWSKPTRSMYTLGASAVVGLDSRARTGSSWRLAAVGSCAEAAAHSGDVYSDLRKSGERTGIVRSAAL